MIACKNCGSQMKFDIVSQQMKCIHCGSLQLPEDSEDYVHETEETEGVFETKIYSCTQCGAELITQDESGVSFCSFCGAQSVFSSITKSLKKPEYVIPFKKTKEDCKGIYLKKLKRALYAPSEMKKAEHVDEFRGIYMPYYIYDVEQTGKYSLKGSKKYREGDYIITENYNLTGKIKGKYNNLTHDASSNFTDYISESIAPYDLGQKRKFNEGFLHGFYGDVADVEADTYRINVTSLANEYAIHQVKALPEYEDLKIENKKDDKDLSNRLGTGVAAIHSGMFPVWFLGYKRRGRMSYATINGQTGKMYADVPVEPWKYMIGTLLLALPILFLLQNMFTFTPGFMVGLCDFFAMITLFLYKSSIGKIIEHSESVLNKDIPREKSNFLPFKINYGVVIKCVLVVLYVVFYLGMGSIFNQLVAIKLLVGVSSGLGIVYSVFCQKDLNKAFELNDKIGVIACDIAFAASAIVIFANPIDDLWYYIVCLISTISILISLIALLISYNILSSRRPRTFVRSGGDDSGI